MKLMRAAAAVSPVVVIAVMGCAPLGPDIEASRKHPETIRWPEAYSPDDATFFIHNEIEVSAPPEVVWGVLIEAETWPEWYEGASDVEVEGDGSVLTGDSVFTWKTMGLHFTSTVTEFEPYERLSWESRKRTIRGLHGWLIIPTDEGCLLITDESQVGSLAGLERAFQPNKLRRLHDIWLAEIKNRSERRFKLHNGTLASMVQP